MEPVAETREEAIVDLESRIELAEKMKKLLANDDFQDIFEERFIKAWTITNTYKMAVYNDETRARVQEGMVARSHFTQFIESIIIDGNTAKKDLAELAHDAGDDNEEESY